METFTKKGCNLFKKNCLFFSFVKIYYGDLLKLNDKIKLTMLCKYIHIYIHWCIFLKHGLLQFQILKVQVLHALYIEVQRGFTFSIKMDLSKMCFVFCPPGGARVSFWQRVAKWYNLLQNDLLWWTVLNHLKLRHQKDLEMHLTSKTILIVKLECQVGQKLNHS